MTESVTVFFPVYRDESTVERVTSKALDVCRSITDDFEVIIVDDGSPDRAGEIADELAAQHPEVRVIHHAQEPRLRRGGALGPARRARRMDLLHGRRRRVRPLRTSPGSWRLRHHYELIITFRYAGGTGAGAS